MEYRNSSFWQYWLLFLGLLNYADTCQFELYGPADLDKRSEMVSSLNFI